MRDFWRGGGEPRRVARRLTGSSDLYESDGRRPFASINFITAHDGFTLHDLVNYNTSTTRPTRRATATGRTTTAPGTAARRGRPTTGGQRPAGPPAAQLPGHAVPLPGHADAPRRRRARPHAARQQQRLVQDNELSWFHWDLGERGKELLEFAQKLIALRRAHPILHRRDFFTGTDEVGSGCRTRGGSARTACA